jgi:hypothetical protein
LPRQTNDKSNVPDAHPQPLNDTVVLATAWKTDQPLSHITAMQNFLIFASRKSEMGKIALNE